MIVRNGVAHSFPVLFPAGSPDGTVQWTLKAPDETVITTGTVAVPVDAVSTIITIASNYNTLDTGKLYSYRDVDYNYVSGGVPYADSFRYAIEARAPFGVSYDGVREKLGVEKEDLCDNDFSLIHAYLAFEKRVTPIQLMLSLDGGLNDFIIRDAIEAIAALALIPTMAVRIAVKESSGTNSYQRQNIDWAALGAALQGIIDAGIAVVLPLNDDTAGFGSIFILAGPAVDAFTGA